MMDGLEKASWHFLFTLFCSKTPGHSFSWGNKKAAHSKQMRGNFTTCNEFHTLGLQIAKEDYRSN